MEAGILLNDLHIVLADHGLAMMNVGSISDQTLAGVITTATHGTGMSYSVISTHVLALTLLLADGSHVMCSRHQNANLFTATLCGLGSTGLILTITLEVEAAFRLKEVQQSLPFDHVISRLDQVASSAEHVKLWWFPAADTVRLSLSDRTQQVSGALKCLLSGLKVYIAKTTSRQLAVAFLARIPCCAVHSIPRTICPVRQ